MKSGVLTSLVALTLLGAVNCSSSSPKAGMASAGQPSSAGHASGGSSGSAGSAQGGASGDNANSASDTSAAVTGPSDAHCVGRPLGISDPRICTSTAGASSFGGAPDTPPNTGGTSSGSGGSSGADNTESGGTNAGGSADCTLSHDAGYGDTLYDSEGDDDECKYHVSWTSTPVEKGKPFTLTVTATSKVTGKPLEHIDAQDPGKPALSRIEPFMPCEPSHLAPTSDYEAPVTEVGPGTFTVGPVVFDESGRWVIRYHFYEECLNNVTTPHAHIAFFVNVP